MCHCTDVCGKSSWLAERLPMNPYPIAVVACVCMVQRPLVSFSGLCFHFLYCSWHTILSHYCDWYSVIYAVLLQLERRSSPVSSFDSIEEFDYSTVSLVGTCQDLEKSYFRLTSAPDPATVRPEAVLKKAL